MHCSGESKLLPTAITFSPLQDFHVHSLYNPATYGDLKVKRDYNGDTDVTRDFDGNTDVMGGVLERTLM